MKSFILKYKWWFSFVCCALLVACEPATTSDQNPISFGAGRKNSAYNSNLSNDDTNAYLWGYRNYTENNTNTTTETIFNGVEARLYDVSTENNSIYDDIEIKDVAKYWNIGTYNFFSVSPKLENASVANNTLTITDFDISTQTDVIAAVPNAITVEGLEYKTPVQLNYTHLLSKIKFQAQTTQNTCTLTHFSITIPKTATYTHTTGSEEDPTTGAWGTKPEKCILSLPKNYTPTINSADETLLDLDGADGKNDNGWLIFPGTVIADNETTSDVNEGIAYSITYTVGNNSQTQTGTLPPLTDSGLANNSYIYTLKIQPSGPIIFGGVSVTPWTSQPETEFDFKIET